MTNNTKKRIVTSIHNLTPEQMEEVKALYPRGFSEVMSRIDKPNGDFFYVVPYETEDTSYLLKIDVKIDENADSVDDDDFFADDEIAGADEIQDEVSSEDDME
ncbi:MAG: hypothetical protein IKY82_00925 [Alistipes sp.]|nr:hypothetical protein [Alistipes sp.]